MSKDPAKTEFLWFLLILGFFGFLWLIMGGPLNPNSQRPFLQPPKPLNYGNTYGEDNLSIPTTTIRIGPPKTSGTPKDVVSVYSPLRGKIKIQYIQADFEGDNRIDEVVGLWADYDNKKPVSITGLKLKSKVTNKSVVIGKGVRIYNPGDVSFFDDVYIPPGGNAYIFTGSSPIGVSFQVNKCMGYLSRFQRAIPSTNCPRIRDEAFPPGVNFDDKCLDFISSIRSCETVTDFAYQSYECQTFVSQRANYTGCVNYHRNDSDFLLSDWYVYLGKTESLWKDRREIVELLDQNDKLIDYYSY
jgi:hypothetical protein